ncbi:MAG: TPM domain-containing protein [Spirosoma sp.]|nr:TPM domain-containing protein [Spirosoma sp.]
MFSPADQQRIIEAIQAAEKATSGEIRVHVEPHCAGSDPVTRAVEVFAMLGMHQTKLQNGVLFYLAFTDRKFAILGDKGIDALVPKGFWQETKEVMRSQFSIGNYVDGLRQGIAQAGQQLKQYFPYDGPSDTNELPDDISFNS